MSYYDRQRLIELGLLKPTDDFQLNTKHSFMKELSPIDRTALLRFKSNIGNLRSDSLVRKTYREFPQFTSRSKIASKHFTDEELKQRQFAFVEDPLSALFSIGYEGLTIDAFLYKLIANKTDPIDRCISAILKLDEFLRSLRIMKDGRKGSRVVFYP